MKDSQQSHDSKMNQAMAQDMSQMMGHIQGMMQNMSAMMTGEKGMNHDKMQEMSKAMRDMSDQMNDMATQLNKGMMDSATTAKMHERMNSMNNTMESMKKSDQ